MALGRVDSNVLAIAARLEGLLRTSLPSRRSLHMAAHQKEAPTRGAGVINLSAGTPMAPEVRNLVDSVNTNPLTPHASKLVVSKVQQRDA